MVFSNILIKEFKVKPEKKVVADSVDHRKILNGDQSGDPALLQVVLKANSFYVVNKDGKIVSGMKELHRDLEIDI